jgi:signal transduction histidine kinase
MLKTALVAAKVGMENLRLNAHLHENLAELQRSRARIVQAGLEERRRVERDLHDGAQQQFLTVAATLARIDVVDDPEVRQVVAAARTQLRNALGELRRLARGIHPASLSQGGLPEALQVLRELAPIPVALTVADPVMGTRLSPTAEAAAYFVAAEALANAIKYSNAEQVLVNVRLEGSDVLLSVSDDGDGGAHFVPAGGLTGLKDRATALGGGVTIHSDPCPTHPGMKGSQVEARLPIVPVEQP